MRMLRSLFFACLTVFFVPFAAVAAYTMPPLALDPVAEITISAALHAPSPADRSSAILTKRLYDIETRSTAEDTERLRRQRE